MKLALIRALGVAFSRQFAVVAARVFATLRPYRGRLVLVGLFSVIVVLLDLLSAAAVAALVLALDNETVLALPIIGELANPLRSLDQKDAAIVCIGGIIALQLVREAVLFANELISKRLGVDVEVHLKSRISKSILSTPFEQMASIKRNDLIVYGTNFASGVAAFASELVQLGSVCVILFFYAASAFVFEPATFLAVGAIMIILVAVTNRMVLRQQRIGGELRDLQLQYHDQLQDSVHGLRDITIVGRRNAFATRINQLIDVLRKARRRSVLLRSAVTPIQRSVALSFCGLGLASFVLLSDKEAPLAGFQSLLVVIFLLLRMYGPVAHLNSIRSGLMARLGVAESLLDFLERHQPPTATSTIEAPRAECAAPNALSEDERRTGAKMTVGDITFNSVSYRYHGSDAAAVENLTFTIPARSTTAIVGPTGAGKSTVIDLLTKLRQPSAGEIRVGGLSLAQIDDGDWRRRVAAIHQHGHIFYGTIAENIAMFRDDVGPQAIEEAAERANLLDFIRAAPDGFDTRLGGPDTPLSGGQRQRLQIARAFLIKPELLILDEATSAQDAIAEDELLRTLKQEFGDSTIVTVAHRFSAIREAHCIVVLQNGRVAESGDWETLSRGEGVFRRLLELQSLEAPPARAEIR